MEILKKPIIATVLVLTLMLISHSFYFQFDLTSDQRYSLSKNSIIQLRKLDKPILIDVFLTGNLPAPYLKFRNELDAILNQLKFFNENIIIKYNDPFELGESDKVIDEMQKYGMSPEIVFENKNGNRIESIIFPWIIVNYGNRSERVSLLKKQLGDNEIKKIIRSLEQIEYNILDGIYKVSVVEKKSLAVLSSHKTSESSKIADLLNNLKSYYNLAAFDLKNKKVSPERSLENLNRFDLVIVSNPKEPFSQNEKYILDQYSLQGGKILWMVNGVKINRDSLFKKSGKIYALPQELNLDDYFFHLGLRIEKTVIQDLYCAPIVLASGHENNTQYLPYPWIYYPLTVPENNSISNNIGPVLCQFVSPIDTLKNKLSKTLLLKSSEFTKTYSMPNIIELEQATNKIQPSYFNEKAKAIGYLVKGIQNSLFKNRIKPFKTEQHIDKGPTQMIVISDGNISENQLDKGFPLSLGYDKWTNNFYANRDLIMNSIHFLTNNEDLLAVNGKLWNVALLDDQKVKKNSLLLKWILLLIPLFTSLLLGLFNQFLRSKHLRW